MPWLLYTTVVKRVVKYHARSVFKEHHLVIFTHVMLQNRPSVYRLKLQIPRTGSYSYCFILVSSSSLPAFPRPHSCRRRVWINLLVLWHCVLPEIVVGVGLDLS